jgi:hypothetical protein
MNHKKRRDAEKIFWPLNSGTPRFSIVELLLSDIVAVLFTK